MCRVPLLCNLQSSVFMRSVRGATTPLTVSETSRPSRMPAVLIGYLLSSELWGCFTWAPLPEGLGVGAEVWHAATPAISDAAFAERQHALRRAIAAIEAEALRF